MILTAMTIDSSTASQDRAVVCTTADQDCDAMDLQLSRSWLRIAVACVFAGQGMVFSLAMNMTPPPFDSTAYWVLHGGLIFSALVVMLFLGGPLFRSTFGMLKARRFSIEGLFTLSLVGAFVGSLVSTLTGAGGVFYEVVSIVIAIYTVGRMLSERSQARLVLESERLRERYDRVQVIDASGETVEIPLAEVTVGTKVRVDPGAPFTVDGVVLSGVGYVRETALTGEPLPVVRHVGDRVRAGTWSVDGAFDLRADAVEGERELDTILQTVEDASGRPSEMQTQANDLIQGFLPLVAGVSAATAIYWGLMGTWVEAVFNSMAVLLVACPCALGLATPVAIWQGLYQLARIGLVSRNGTLIDALAQTRHVFFDKTGTLSESTMRVAELLIADTWSGEREVLLSTISAIESRVAHPIARALVDSISIRNHPVQIESLQLLPGQGVEARVTMAGEIRTIRIGEAELVGGNYTGELKRQMTQLIEQGGKRSYVFIDGRPAAIFVLREQMRSGLASIWERLSAMGIRASVLTGDPNPPLAFPPQVELQAGLSAAQKEVIVTASVQAGDFPVLVGDGINDAAAMSQASGSIAMGSGAGFTCSAASGQLTADRVDVLPEAIRLARSVYRRLRGNLIYAACYNLIGMGLAAAGLLHPVAAAVIMLISSFMVTARALSSGKNDN
jgi:heavy metal translocating P-type ATPase